MTKIKWLEEESPPIERWTIKNNVNVGQDVFFNESIPDYWLPEDVLYNINRGDYATIRAIEFHQNHIIVKRGVLGVVIQNWEIGDSLFYLPALEYTEDYIVLRVTKLHFWRKPISRIVCWLVSWYWRLKYALQRR